MALAAADFEHAMSQLLPQGAVWEQFRERIHVLLAAMSQEPARLVVDGLAALESQIPDSTAADLDHFERIVGAPTENLTDAERLARIRSLLFGRRHVDQPYLEQVVQAMAGDTNVRLFSRLFAAPCGAGVSRCGDRLSCGEWRATWLCELMPNVVQATPDGFGSWTGFTSHVAGATYSPVTFLQTAAQVGIPDLAGAVIDLDSSAGDSATVYASVWIKAVSADFDARVRIRRRDGSFAGTGLTAVTNQWRFMSVEQALGTGSTSAQLQLVSVTGTHDAYVSWAVAGVRNTSLENRISALFPIHTHGWFSVQNEFALLVEGDQDEVQF